MLLASISYPPVPLVEVGPLRLSLHGVFAALGFLAGAWIATRDVRRRGLDSAGYQSALTWGLIGALLGARLFTIPAEIIDEGFSWSLFSLTGNFSILGGFAGGILAGGWRMRMLGLPIMPMLDSSTTGLALGTVIGRIGDLAIVEHLGSRTDFFLGYAVQAGFDLAPQHDALECTGSVGTVCTDPATGLPAIYHHAALYDMLGAALLFAVLLLLRQVWVSRRPGQLFAFWVLWYGLQRFLIDAVRYGSGDATVGPFTWNQVSGLVAAVGAAVLIWWFGRRPEKAATPPLSPPADDAETVTEDDST